MVAQKGTHARRFQPRFLSNGGGEPGFLPLRACLGFSSFELAFVRRNNDTANIMYCPAFAGALRNETGRDTGGKRRETGSVGGQTVKNRGERNNGVAFAKNNRYISREYQGKTSEKRGQDWDSNCPSRASLPLC